MQQPLATQNQTTLRYRPDIDGLRALAVLPVVLYHFRIPGFTGGFVGVDVFFVISGFLITSLIEADLQAGRFSLAGFYERRARRILPALFAMIAVSLAAAFVIFFPEDLLQVAKSAIGAVFFVANFFFWGQVGYFDKEAAVKPLLHTWSLAVEEQFYLVFPALLFLLRTRRREVLVTIIAGIALISFVASAWAVRTMPVSAFYLVWFRFWELMLGALIAIGGIRAPSSRVARGALTALGIALIAWPVFAYTRATPFPGVAALPPCLGAGLVIFAGGAGDIIGRVLSSRPFVSLGLVSYSFYLWHWPVYVFSKYLLGPLDLFAKLALIALSLALAVVSWRYIERPFRDRHGWFDRRRLVVSLSSAAMAGIAVAIALFVLDGVPERFPPDIRALLATENEMGRLHDSCFEAIEDSHPDKLPLCRFGDTARHPSVAIWGDSHASALEPVMDELAGKVGRSGLLLGRSRCPPLLDVMIENDNRHLCAQFNRAALAALQDRSIRTVVLSARWPIYERGAGYGSDADERIPLVDLSNSGRPAAGQHERFTAALERTIEALVDRGKQVIVVAPVPEANVALPEALARKDLYRLGGPPTLSRAAYEARDAGVLAALHDLAQRYPIHVVDPAKILCTAAACDFERNDQALYMDHDHLSTYGARALEPIFEDAFFAVASSDDSRGTP